MKDHHLASNRDEKKLGDVHRQIFGSYLRDDARKSAHDGNFEIFSMYQSVKLTYSAGVKN